jgi:Tol biopolymer transport system component
LYLVGDRAKIQGWRGDEMRRSRWRWRYVGIASAALAIAGAASADAARARVSAEEPYWSAHGRLIAFTGYPDGHLWVMNADGSQRHRIAGSTLSPSGRMVAESFDTGNAGLVLIERPNGKLIKQFIVRVRADAYGPVVWAPDERAVAVSVFPPGPPGREKIFVADLRRGLYSVSRVRSQDDSPSPAWSPDSRRIAFVSCPSAYRGHCQLTVVNRDGSGRKVVVRDIGGAGEYSVQAAWSPDGGVIAFARRFGPTRSSNTEPPPQRYGVYVVRPDGTGLHRIATTPFMVSGGIALAWSPDSRHVAFVDTRGVSIVDVPGRQRVATRLGRDGSSVSWAPSTRILFSDRGHVYTVIPGRRPVRVLP